MDVRVHLIDDAAQAIGLCRDAGDIRAPGVGAVLGVVGELRGVAGVALHLCHVAGDGGDAGGEGLHVGVLRVRFARHVGDEVRDAIDGAAALAARLREVARERGDFGGGALRAAHDRLEVRDKFVEIRDDPADLVVAFGVHPSGEVGISFGDVGEGVGEHGKGAQDLGEDDEECAVDDDEGEEDDDLLYGLGGGYFS